MPPEAQWAIAIVGSYLIGAIPFGLIIGRLKGIDIRAHGSGNIGATNVMRTLGKPLGLLCFFLDVCKGALPVVGFGLWLGVIGAQLPGGANAWLWLAVASSAVLGHIFPVFLRFKGGKGVATGFGAMLGLWPGVTLAAIACAVIWFIVMRLFRYVSLASIIAGLMLPVCIGAIAAARTGTIPWPFVIAGSVLALVVVWTHRANIQRLRAGAERRVGEPRPTAQPSNDT